MNLESSSYRPEELRPSQISKLSQIYQELQCYPEKNLISSTADQFEVTFAVVAVSNSDGKILAVLLFWTQNWFVA